MTKRKSSTCAYVDCDRGASKDVETRPASWTSAPVVDTEHRWSLLNKAAAASCSESHQCCQELQWAAMGPLIWARIYHSATREPQMRGSIPATACSLAPHTQTWTVSNSMWKVWSLLTRINLGLQKSQLCFVVWLAFWKDSLITQL